MSLTVYISITDSFFLWGSQRKRLIYVDAIYVSIVAPMLHTLSLLTRFILTKPMVVTQLPFSMNRWIPFFQNRKWQYLCFLQTTMALIFFYHTRFDFVGTFKKAVTNPATKFCSRDKPMFGARTFYVIYRLWVLSWSFSPPSPSGAFVKLSSVTSTSYRSDHYPIFRKLCLQKAMLKVLQPPLAALYLCTHPLLTLIMRSKCNLSLFRFF